jgi:hypothetical protein
MTQPLNGSAMTAEEPSATPTTPGPDETRRLTLLLRLEGLALAILSIVAYVEWGENWWLFALLILAPDLAALGYVVNRRVGAATYNFAHWYALPAALAVVAILTDDTLVLSLALIWSTHISVDRAIGYGLKYPSNPRRTHLSWPVSRDAGA